MYFKKIFTKIKRRETPYYRRLYSILKSINVIDVPVVQPLAAILYAERSTRLACWDWLIQNFYYTPLFKSQCKSYGKKLQIYGGIPLIMGEISIHFGDSCSLHGASSIIGSKMFDEPTLRIGNNVHLGHRFSITVGADISIGNDVLIAGGVQIFSYDTHHTDPEKRFEPPPKETGKSVTVEDNVWIGGESIILKGVTIGKNSVVGSGSVITKSIPPNCIAVGNPFRIIPFTADNHG